MVEVRRLFKGRLNNQELDFVSYHGIKEHARINQLTVLLLGFIS